MMDLQESWGCLSLSPTTPVESIADEAMVMKPPVREKGTKRHSTISRPRNCAARDAAPKPDRRERINYR